MISEEDLCSLHQVSAQDLHKRSSGKICVQELYVYVYIYIRALSAQISLRDLLARPLDKTSPNGLLAMTPGQDLYKRSHG